MNNDPKSDTSHEVLAGMAEKDAEQPGDTPSDAPIHQEVPKKETEDAPRETD